MKTNKKYLLFIWKVKNLKKFASKVLLLSIILNILTTNLSLAYDNIDRYSKGSILIDQLTNRTLYEKKPDQKMPLASLSKMMTFLIAIESIKTGKTKASDIVEIDEETARVGGSSYKLKKGEKIPLIELMNGLMIVSGNDAAVAIAKHVGGNVENFVKIMNQKTKQLGMKNTTFVNPNGLPIYNLKEPSALPNENISTPRDIAILAKYMFDNYEKEVTSITDKEIYSYPERGFCKNNTNVLLQLIEDVDGVKTGYTGNAGYCLCFSMKIHKDINNDCNNRIIGVVLGTNHKNKRTQASISLLKYAKQNFKTKRLFQKNQIVGKRYLYGIPDMEVVLKTNQDLYIICKENEKIKSEITLKEIKYPIKKGETIGVIKYYDLNGKELAKLDIISENDLKDASLKNKIKIFSQKGGF